MNVLVRNSHRGVTRERNLPGEHFKQHNANRIKVGANVYFLSLCLFGGEVGSGSQNGGGCCNVVEGLCNSSSNTEVQNLHLALTGEHDVIRLDVTVNNALVVCKLNSREQFFGHANSFRNLERPTSDKLG